MRDPADPLTVGGPVCGGCTRCLLLNAESRIARTEHIEQDQADATRPGGCHVHTQRYIASSWSINIESDAFIAGAWLLNFGRHLARQLAVRTIRSVNQYRCIGPS